MKFYSMSQFTIQGEKCFSVKNPVECQDFEWLLNKKVIINGDAWIVIGSRDLPMRRLLGRANLSG